MASDDRDILEIFKEELDFLEEGGYRASLYRPWEPKSVFQDSMTCINYGYPYRVHPCNECHLVNFVNPEHLNEPVPCHFIPLNKDGETVDSLRSDQAKLESELKAWLRRTINEIEEERSQLAMAGCP